MNSQNQLLPIVFQSKRNMPHFLKLVFISPTVIESHSFESFEKIWEWSCSSGLVPSIKCWSFRFWVILLKNMLLMNEIWPNSMFEKQWWCVVSCSTYAACFVILDMTTFPFSPWLSMTYCNRILMMLYFLSVDSLPHHLDQFVFQLLVVSRHLLFLWSIDVVFVISYLFAALLTDNPPRK